MCSGVARLKERRRLMKSSLDDSKTREWIGPLAATLQLSATGAAEWAPMLEETETAEDYYARLQEVCADANRRRSEPETQRSRRAFRPLSSFKVPRAMPSSDTKARDQASARSQSSPSERLAPVPSGNGRPWKPKLYVARKLLPRTRQAAGPPTMPSGPRQPPAFS